MNTPIAPGDGAGFVVAARRINQNPLTDAPDVPSGTRGHVEDEADGYLWIDFGGRFGTVCCEQDEVK